MQVKKITAKIRDMVKVSLMENGDERAWYNNIEMPDAIKELEMKDYHFHVLGDGKIEFQIHFEKDVLPKDFPMKKARRHRTAPVAADTKAAPPSTAVLDKAEAKQDEKALALAEKPVIKPETTPITASPIDAKPTPKDAVKKPTPAAAPAVKHGPKLSAATPADTKPLAPKAPAKPGPKANDKKAI